MNPESLLAQFECCLPLAAAWATEEEQKILRDGVSLSEKEIGDARAIGVQRPGSGSLVTNRNDPATDAASAQSRLRRD